MRDEKEERKKQARSNKQTRQRNTAYPRQSLFLEKNELPQVGLACTFSWYPIIFASDCISLLLYMSESPVSSYGYMLPNLSPSPNLYKVQSVYNNNVIM